MTANQVMAEELESLSLDGWLSFEAAHGDKETITYSPQQVCKCDHASLDKIQKMLDDQVASGIAFNIKVVTPVGNYLIRSGETAQAKWGDKATAVEG